MAAAIFIVYLLFFGWLVTRVPFLKKSGLGPVWLAALFMCKVAAGIAYARFYALPQYFAGSDTWRFFEESKAETRWLLTNPVAFFRDIFHYGYSSSGGLFSGHSSYWNDLKSNVIIKLLAVCNVFTLSNYYADVVLFNFLFFFGPVAFYRVMATVFPQKKWIAIVTVFFLPSFLFWCSGIHKDGLMFACIGLLAYSVNKLMAARRLLLKPLALCLLCFAFLFALRNIICLLLVPAFAVWYLAGMRHVRGITAVACVYGACLVMFFALPYVSRQLNLPQYTVEKQTEFKQLQGGSQIQVRTLRANFTSFVQFLPQALDIALLRPHISEIKNISYLPAVAELFLLWFIAGVFLCGRKKGVTDKRHAAVILFCICFTVSYLLLCGYTVTFSGAVVRYKSIVLPLISCPLACMVNIDKK